MIRRRLGNLFLILGFIAAASAFLYYLNISRAQSSMLADNEEAAIEIEASMQSKNDNLQPVSSEETVAFRESYKNGQMIISIPKLKVEAAVVEGTTIALLKLGPGLFESSPLPNEEGGNVCIAGHRTTYGAWFRHVDELKEGDDVNLEYNGTTFSYKVERVFVVDKKDWSVTEPQGYSALTLIACHPLGSSQQRIVVRGRLTE